MRSHYSVMKKEKEQKICLLYVFGQCGLWYNLTGSLAHTHSGGNYFVHHQFGAGGTYLSSTRPTHTHTYRGEPISTLTGIACSHDDGLRAQMSFMDFIRCLSFTMFSEWWTAWRRGANITTTPMLIISYSFAVLLLRFTFFSSSPLY